MDDVCTSLGSGVIRIETPFNEGREERKMSPRKGGKSTEIMRQEVLKVIKGLKNWVYRNKKTVHAGLGYYDLLKKLNKIEKKYKELL